MYIRLYTYEKYVTSIYACAWNTYCKTTLYTYVRMCMYIYARKISNVTFKYKVTYVMESLANQIVTHR